MIQHAVIEGLEPNADVLTIHIALTFPYRRRPARVISTISKTSPNSKKSPYAKVRTNELGPREPARANPKTLN
jgi:hypothetical protein